jgi:hypothetical protein
MMFQDYALERDPAREPKYEDRVGYDPMRATSGASDKRLKASPDQPRGARPFKKSSMARS